MSNKKVINSFSDMYRFLSNYYPVQIKYAGIDYPSVGHAYQAQKITNIKIQKEIASIPKASQAKNWGKKFEILGQIDKTYWTDKFRLETMENLLRLKFSSKNSNRQLADSLIGTGKATLIEGNTCGYTFFDVFENQGQNHLGKLLMKVRHDLVLESNPEVQKVFNAAKDLFPVFLQLHEDVLGGRKGINLGIFDKRQNFDNYPILHKIIGELPEDKQEEKSLFAEDKITRMIVNQEISSFLSEDIKNKHFGGGIETSNFYLGPSGLPPHLDQKFAIMLALMLDDLGVGDYSAIKNLTLVKVNFWRRENGEIPMSLTNS